ncbi:MAG: DNA primase [Thermodesulfobacteria bacterium]|nr:DNA primase [Thermodesulfobacteriota bacterium]
MTYIPEDILQTIRETADIRQVVQEFVPLKKRGKNWVGLCPFHSDKDPSFTVNEDKQIFYCFGCGEGGNVFKFLMKIQGISFPEAARALAQRYGITIPERPVSAHERKKKELKEQLLELTLEASHYFTSQLESSKTAELARNYLESRGLDDETIKTFQLGWAEDSWDGLTSHLESKGLDLELAEQAGLIIKRANAPGWYDRFRGRIIFPIHDHQGNIVAFGGRTVGLPGQEEQPKYINSPESPIYKKGKILYGLYQNKGAIRKAGYGLMVEGYMDVVSLWQFGIRQAVASLGTAMTEDHGRRMKGVTKEWVLLFDADEAGLKAATRALPICYKVDLRPKVLVLPEGEDPDSFVRKNGPDKLLELVSTAQSGLDYLIDMGKRHFGTDTEGTLKTIESALDAISQVQDPVRKSLFVGHISRKLGVREESLWQNLERRERNKPLRVAYSKDKGNDAQAKPKVLAKRKNRAEEKILGFLLSYPQYMDRFLDLGLELWLEDRDLAELWDAMVHLHSLTGRLSLSELYERLEHAPELRSTAMRLASAFPPCSDIESMVKDLEKSCMERKKRALRMQLIQQIREQGEEGDCEHLLRDLLSLR